jgi:hypothetical protein
MSQFQWEFALYKETLEKIALTLEKCRDGLIDEVEALYDIDTLIYEVGLDE